MALTTGTKLGPYEITAAIGAGGMGEVYRARDLKLQRDVALKLLPDAFASDPDRLARFEREATTLAALNHPNIAQVYGVEESNGVRALVMEFVPGETIEALIAHGPVASGLSLPDVLSIARQIANALEAAHEQGIVHRDLKPANVKVKPDGTVKVLDFGLAKALGPDAGGSGSPADVANSPTLTARMSPGTQVGMILGTAAYMAPEQARGKAVDRRADIWAFGVLLYEMLTGRRAFEGDDVSDVLAAVLKTEPAWTAMPVDTPDAIRRVLRRCLEKDPRKRLSSIGDARLELDEAETTPHTPLHVAAPVMTAARRSPWSRAWPALAAVVITAAVTSLLWKSATRLAPADLTRTSLLSPPGADIYPDSTTLAISPDGRQVAFVVGSATISGGQLWVRSLDQPKPRRIEAGDGARLPFWSPDSTRIGFFADRKLKIVAAAGGRAETIADSPFGRGGTWSPSDVIVFAGDASGGLWRMRASGGEAVPVTTLDATRKQSGHRFPEFLPDGHHFLYVALPATAGKFDVFVGSIDGGAPILIGSMESSPVYADPGWLIFTRNGVLVAQAFDPKRFTISGDPIPLEDEPTVILDPTMSMTAGHAASVSSTGALVYFSAASENTIATWLDATGRPTGTLSLPPGPYSSIKISPDGSRAIAVRSTSRSESTLWLWISPRASVEPLSSGRGRNDSPIWSPDGARVVFVSDREGPQNLYMKTVGTTTAEELYFRGSVLFLAPDSWSVDGKSIVIQQLDAESAYNLWLLPTDGAQTLVPLVKGRLRDVVGSVSPDGHWLSYLSEDTGRFDLYVQAFPKPGQRTAASADGALFAWWTRDSRALIFSDGLRATLWQVPFDPATGRLDSPKRLGTLPPDLVWMDAMPDRQKFLALLPERAGPGSITVVQNWQRSLRR